MGVVGHCLKTTTESRFANSSARQNLSYGMNGMLSVSIYDTLLHLRQIPYLPSMLAEDEYCKTAKDVSVPPIGVLSTADCSVLDVLIARVISVGPSVPIVQSLGVPTLLGAVPAAAIDDYLYQRQRPSSHGERSWSRLLACCLSLFRGQNSNNTNNNSGSSNNTATNGTASLRNIPTGFGVSRHQYPPIGIDAVREECSSSSSSRRYRRQQQDEDEDEEVNAGSGDVELTTTIGGDASSPSPSDGRRSVISPLVANSSKMEPVKITIGDDDDDDDVGRRQRHGHDEDSPYNGDGGGGADEDGSTSPPYISGGPPVPQRLKEAAENFDVEAIAEEPADFGKLEIEATLTVGEDLPASKVHYMLTMMGLSSLLVVDSKGLLTGIVTRSSFVGEHKTSASHAEIRANLLKANEWRQLAG